MKYFLLKSRKILNFFARVCMGNRKRYAKFQENLLSSYEIKIKFLPSTFLQTTNNAICLFGALRMKNKNL